MKKYFIHLIIVLILVALPFWFLSRKANESSTTISINDTTVKVDIADSTAEQERGLSGRKSLSEGEGMLFVFPDEQFRAFWMKDMNFPIDIIWISDDKKIVDIAENLSPDTYPQTFSPNGPARFVLEVPAGWADRNKISVGDFLNF